jgi:hypothetical protein
MVPPFAMASATGAQRLITLLLHTLITLLLHAPFALPPIAERQLRSFLLHCP